jgi:ankyrin repeat protein
MIPERFVKSLAALLVIGGLGAANAANLDAPLVDAVKKADAAAVRALIGQRVDVNQPGVDGTTALHWAVHSDSVELTDLLLRAGANVNATNRYGATALSLACINGSVAVVDRLLKAGANPNTVFADGQTALMTAARTGKVEVVKLLLANGADVNAKEGYRGQTALMWAAAQGHAETVKALIELGADIQGRSKGSAGAVRAAVRAGVSQLALGAGTGVPAPADTRATVAPAGLTPLLFAVRGGHVAATEALLDAGANVNDTVGDGTSALVLAVMNAQYDVAAALLKRGANPNADTQGWTALHQLVWTRRPNLMRPTPFPLPTGKVTDLELVKLLVAAGANPNARQKAEPNDGNRNVLNRLGATPFLLAAKAADVDMMRTLAANGADPLLKTDEGATPLMAAAGVGIWRVGENVGTNEEALEAVKLAWELGNDVNAIDANGDTALHGAVHRGANGIVEFLMAKGANPDVANTFGWTPLTIAEGIWYPNTYKSEPETGILLRKLGARNEGKRRPEDYPPTLISAPVEGGRGGGQTGTQTQTGAQQAPAPRPPQR